MDEIKKLWDELKNLLHHGPSTQPLWQAMIDQMHAVEARLVALETGLEDRVKQLLVGATITGTVIKSDYDTAIAALEARIAALETGLKEKIDALISEAEGLFRDNMSKAMQAEFDSLVAGFETRINALEEKLTLMSTPSEPQPEPAPAPAPAASTEPVKPTEEIVHPDTPAAASAIDSSAAGENAGEQNTNESPDASLKPDPDSPAGLT